MKKILIADDSALMRKTLCDIILEADKNVLISNCSDGEEALTKIRQSKLDLVFIDLYLPRKNAIEVISELQKTGDMLPVVVIGSSLNEDLDIGSLAGDDKEVAYQARPFRLLGEERKAFGDSLLRKADQLLREQRRMAPFQRKEGTEEKAPASTPAFPTKTVARSSHDRLVLVASSTGGPQALHRMIPMLPGNLGVPVVCVQHMPKGFTASLAERIDQTSHVHVKEAAEGEELRDNVVYIAPGGRHLTITEHGGHRFCHVTDDPPVNNLRPCADVTFDSVCGCSYDSIVCAVLTGMGHDGTDGIRHLKKKKQVHVISQSSGTCVVYGMPKSVDQTGLSDESVPIDEVASAIARELGV